MGEGAGRVGEGVVICTVYTHTYINVGGEKGWCSCVLMCECVGYMKVK